MYAVRFFGTFFDFHHWIIVIRCIVVGFILIQAKLRGRSIPLNGVGFFQQGLIRLVGFLWLYLIKSLRRVTDDGD